MHRRNSDPSFSPSTRECASVRAEASNAADPRAIWESLTQAQRMWLERLSTDPLVQPYSAEAIAAAFALEDAGLIDPNWDDATDLGRAVAAAGKAGA